MRTWRSTAPKFASAALDGGRLNTTVVDRLVRHGEVELYYHVSGLAVGVPYQTTLEFVEVTEPTEAAFTLTFTDEAPAHFVEAARRVGLENLKPGRYRLQVTVASGTAHAGESALLTVTDN